MIIALLRSSIALLGAEDVFCDHSNDCVHLQPTLKASPQNYKVVTVRECMAIPYPSLFLPFHPQTLPPPEDGRPRSNGHGTSPYPFHAKRGAGAPESLRRETGEGELRTQSLKPVTCPPLNGESRVETQGQWEIFFH